MKCGALNYLKWFLWSLAKLALIITKTYFCYLIQDNTDAVCIVYGYDKDAALERVSTILKMLSSNCGGKVISIGHLYAVLKFGTLELMERSVVISFYWRFLCIRCVSLYHSYRISVCVIVMVSVDVSVCFTIAMQCHVL